MKGTIVYAMYFSTSKEIKRSKGEEAIKPVKSSPNYEEYFPKFKIIKVIDVEIKKVKCKITIKYYKETNILLEAEFSTDNLFSGKNHDIQAELFTELKKIAQEYQPSDFYEEYTFYRTQELVDVDKFVGKRSGLITSLLKAEPYLLTYKEIKDTIASQIRYAKDDIVILDWDGAFIIGDDAVFKETVGIIGIANIQLLNLRLLDASLEKEIDKIRDVQGKRGFFQLLTMQKLQNDIIQIRTTHMIELENIEKALKFYGDWYTAKLYTLAVTKFYLDRWKTSIENKLRLIQVLYDMISTGVSETYNLVLEASIVVLIVLEIVIAFFLY